jgi:hypothetical protein
MALSVLFHFSVIHCCLANNTMLPTCQLLRTITETTISLRFFVRGVKFSSYT